MMTLVFRDNFLEPNAATLGGNYSHVVSGFSVLANQATSTTTGSTELYRGIAPADATIIATEGTPVDTGHVWGVIARRVDANNYYEARVNAGNVDLIKVVAGVTTVIGGPTVVTRAVGSPLQYDLVGGTHQVWYNGVLLFTVTDTAFTLGGAQTVGFTYAGSGTLVLNRFDARWDDTFAQTPNAFSITPIEYSEIVEYDSGFIQRNLVWLRPKYMFSIGYEALRDDDTTYMYIRNFFRKRRGQYQSFIIQDPTLAGASPAGSIGYTSSGPEVFAVADGVSTLYKVGIDKATGIRTYTDGTLDSPQPVISLATGIVIYATAPYAGAVLSYDATATYYRAYMIDAQVEYVRKVPSFWTAKFTAMQDKVLIEGVGA